MRSIVWWTALTSGACENLTLTWVPPRKSMSSGIPCQNTMESTPATLKISEKAMKYHFLPRKSMFALLKNSTLLRPLQNLRTCHSERARLRAGEEPDVSLQFRLLGSGPTMPRTRGIRFAPLLIPSHRKVTLSAAFGARVRDDTHRI